ncbi:MAG: ABC-F family ATPase [Gammaproteobacteria bacterium]|nr:MAG: ABC-F family ATPase [Gammaproteobacteria bacterium]
MLTSSNITIQFGEKPLFENVSVKFAAGNRYGLIGANGSGKSTFMKILSGDLDPTAGNISLDAGQTMATLKQDQFAYEDVNVLDAVIMGDEKLWAVKHKRDMIYDKGADMSDEDGIEVAHLEEEFGEMNGYSAEARAGEILLGAGIEESLHDGKMSAVAPGWKLRVLLAQALFANPDFLLLDEPTNHLDINSISWLETILLKRKCTMIIISHDRHFLNTVCTHMADLDYGKIQLYHGNYDEYMQASSAARSQTIADNDKKKKEIAQLQQFVSRFSANASKSKQATSRQKQIDKITLQHIKPSSRKNPYIRFEQQEKLHRNAFTALNLANSYNDEPPLFKNLKIIVEAGQKIAVIGPNGAGKTTLLKTIISEKPATCGEIKWAEKASYGYLPQDNQEEFKDKNQSLTDWISQWGRKGDDDQVIRGTLGRMLFSGDEVGKPVKVLSGGEKSRMLFGKLILQKNNILILDEPTNHLDMESIESLNNALEDYEGTVIFVSHDRTFVSSLANRIIEFTPDGIVDYAGNYEDYIKSKK